MDNKKLNIYRNKLLVSELIIDVLNNKKTVQEALSFFPKEKDDINIKCAFDALMHREADEEYRLKVKDYADTQDLFLNDLAIILKENKEVPLNIKRQYLNFYQENVLSSNDGKFNVKNILKELRRMINF